MAQRVAVQEWMGAHEEPLVAAVEAAVVVAPILAVLALLAVVMQQVAVAHDAELVAVCVDLPEIVGFAIHVHCVDHWGVDLVDCLDFLLLQELLLKKRLHHQHLKNSNHILDVDLATGEK